MKQLLRFVTLTLLVCGFCSLSHAQEQVGMTLDFFGYIDNREYKSSYTTDKTYLGTIISPKLYFAIDSNNRIYGGLNYQQAFGMHQENKGKVSPIVYYNFKNEHFDLALGHMPRYERLKNVPRLVLSDTLFYDRPNIEGMYFAYQNKHIKQAIYIDWLSAQSYEHRERFMAGLSGELNFGRFYLADDALLYHNALTSNEAVEEHIQDNAILLLRAGIDLSRKTFLDSLRIDAGIALGYDRVRSEYDRGAKGFISNIHLGYKAFSIHNTLYLGDPLNLPNGDSFYHRKRYDRLDLGWSPFQKGNLEGRLTASFHITSDQISNQQAFTLRYRFGRKIW